MRIYESLKAIVPFLFVQASGETINIQWKATTYDPLIISAADEIIFTYGEAHNVYKFDNEAAYNDCDFARASLFGASSDGQYRFAPGIPGIFRFGCAMGSHCASMGQKIAITVQASGEGNSQYNQYDTVMAGSAPVESEYFNEGEEVFTKIYEVASDIPGDRVTTYGWIGWDFPSDKDYHVVGFEAIANSSEFLHHYVLKMCMSESGYNYPGPGVMRDHREKVYRYQRECRPQIWGWALGVSYFMVPKDAGFLMGQSAHAGKALELNVHYDNPLKKKGKKDISYLKLYYTTAVRKHNLGVLEIGSGAPDAVAPIPPQRRNFYNAFGARCYLSQDVTIIGHLSHAHLLGRSIVTEKWKLPSSKTLPPELVDSDYGRDPQFFFDNQHYVSWNSTKAISNQDYLTISCIFDSRGRTEWTQGGLATQDEMCINFLVYYPYNGKERCKVVYRKAQDMPDDYDSTNFPASMINILTADGWDGYGIATDTNAQLTTTTATQTVANSSHNHSTWCLYLLFVLNCVILDQMSKA